MTNYSNEFLQTISSALEEQNKIIERLNSLTETITNYIEMYEENNELLQELFDRETEDKKTHLTLVK